MNLTRLLVISGVVTVLPPVPPLCAQNEVPTKVTNQNRSGELPFSDSVGTAIEHVDVASGTLSVQIPIVSIPGRGLNSDLYYRFNSNYFLLAPRVDSFGHPYYLWTIEQNSGWQTNHTTMTTAWQHVTCDTVNGQPMGSANFNTSYISSDPSGVKHPLAVQTENGYCAGAGDATGPDLTGEGMEGTTSGFTLADGTQISPDNNGNGTWKDSNGNIKTGTTDTLGRTFYTTQQT